MFRIPRQSRQSRLSGVAQTALIAVAALAAALANPWSAEARTQAGQRTAGQTATGVRNILLVHGAFADGSGWRGVYDDLVARGYHVSVVQTPLTSLEADVDATRRVLDRQDGPVILVGHSYGGVVITEAGEDPRVAGLVYVAAFAPNPGESALDQYAIIAPPPAFKPEATADDFNFLAATTFRAAFAADLPQADADFLRDAQVPVLTGALGAKVTRAAWSSRPNWYVVATEDGAIDPELQRLTARRILATTTEVPGSHVVFISQPAAVAAVIAAAALAAGTDPVQ